MSETVAILLLCGLVLAVVVSIAWQMSRCGAGWMVWVLYVIARLYVGWVFRWRSNRPCPFPAEGPALIIANHTSAADPMVLWANHHLGKPARQVRTISFMMAREYYEVGALTWLFKALRTIVVSRDGKDMRPVRAALRLLQDGRLVGVFPEGRLNIGGEGLLSGNPGVGWLALKARLPVYPVFLCNVPGGANMVASFLTRGHVRVIYGDPIDLSQFYGQKATRQLLQTVTDILMDELASLGGVERDSAEAPATIPVTTPLQQRAG